MMRIINKIYIWFKKVILNILGVIRDMINKDNEYEVEMMKAKCEMAKYIIEKSTNCVKYIVEKSTDSVKYIFGSRKNRAVIGIISMTLSSGLLLSAYIKLPEDEGAIDDAN